MHVSNTVSGKRYAMGLLAGLIFTVPITPVISWDFNMMIGSVTQIDPKKTNPFQLTADCGTSFRFQVSETLFLSIKADLICTEFSRGNPYGAYKFMPVRAGLAFYL